MFERVKKDFIAFDKNKNIFILDKVSALLDVFPSIQLDIWRDWYYYIRSYCEFIIDWRY